MDPSSSPLTRPGRVEDIPAMVDLMRRAFRTDPYYRWLCPRDEKWDEFANLSFGASMRRLVPAGTTNVNRDLTCVSFYSLLRNRPGKAEQLRQVRDQLRAAHLLGFRQVRNVARGFRALAAQSWPRPHGYMGAVAVEPELQNTGLVKEFSDYFFAHMNDVDEPLMSMATRDLFLKFYERYGYYRWGEPVTLPGGGPTVYPVVRLPDGLPPEESAYGLGR